VQTSHLCYDCLFQSPISVQGELGREHDVAIFLPLALFHVAKKSLAVLEFLPRPSRLLGDLGIDHLSPLSGLFRTIQYP
jgi:hypothetical protein